MLLHSEKGKAATNKLQQRIQTKGGELWRDISKHH